MGQKVNEFTAIKQGLKKNFFPKKILDYAKNTLLCKKIIDDAKKILDYAKIVNQVIFASNRKVFQRKVVIIYLQHNFFMFPNMLIFPSDIFSSTTVMLLGQVFTLKR